LTDWLWTTAGGSSL
jgi:hypothetical protein